MGRPAVLFSSLAGGLIWHFSIDNHFEYMYERPTDAPEAKHRQDCGFTKGFNPFVETHKPYQPNFFSLPERLTNFLLAAALIAYATFGVYIDDLYIPTSRRRGMHLQSASAWLMCLAIVCAAAVLFALVVDHYDRRNNEHHYERFKKGASMAGWGFFCVALFWHVVSALRA